MRLPAALRAAAAELPIKKLILADPPYTPHGDNDETHIDQFAAETAKVRELHDRGDHRANAARFLGGFGLSAEEVDGILDSRNAANELANAIPRAEFIPMSTPTHDMSPEQLANTIKGVLT